MTIKWEELEPVYGPPYLDSCEAGPTSHTWVFNWEKNGGMSITTSECDVCDRYAQENDWPGEYLCIETPVRLETRVEKYGDDVDYYVVMHPVTGEER